MGRNIFWRSIYHFFLATAFVKEDISESFLQRKYKLFLRVMFHNSTYVYEHFCMWQNVPQFKIRTFMHIFVFGKNVNKVAIFEVSSAAFSTTRFDDRNDGMISSVHFIIPESRPQCREGLVFLRDGPRQHVKNVFRKGGKALPGWVASTSSSEEFHRLPGNWSWQDFHRHHVDQGVERWNFPRRQENCLLSASSSSCNTTGKIHYDTLRWGIISASRVTVTRIFQNIPIPPKNVVIRPNAQIRVT